MKKLLVLACCIALLNDNASADTVTYVLHHPDEKAVAPAPVSARPIKYTEVDVQPIFTGLADPLKDKTRVIKDGDTSLYNTSPTLFRRWVMEQVENPQKLEGKMRVGFLISPEGDVANVKILESLDSALDAEVERIIWSSPKWKAGQHGGKPAAVSYVIRLTFSKQSVSIRRRISKDSTLYNIRNVDVAPTFLGGGSERFGMWIRENIRYPKNQNKTQFPEVQIIVAFDIDTSGAVTKVRVLRGAQHEMADEIRRVVERSPKWTPGVVRGKPVRVKYAQPVRVQY